MHRFNFVHRITLVVLIALGSSAVWGASGSGGGGSTEPPSGETGQPPAVVKYWQGAKPLYFGLGQPSNASIAMNSRGDAMVVWFHHDGARGNIWAMRYTAGIGWGTAAIIASENRYVYMDYGESPRIAIDPTGNAIAVWSWEDGTRYKVWAIRYTVIPSRSGSRGYWGTVQQIDSIAAGHAKMPQVALDGSGNAIAIWQQLTGTRWDIWASRHSPGSGWDAAQPVETDNAGYAELPQIAFDPNGNAIAVWNQYDGTQSNIISNRYTVANGWGRPTLIETNSDGKARDAQIGIDAGGSAIAVWSQKDATRYNIWANRYSGGLLFFTNRARWGTAQLIETSNNGYAENPRIALDAAGNGIVVWFQSDGRRKTIWSNRYSAASGWGTEQIITGNDLGSAILPQIAVDPAGNAFAVWQSYDGASSRIWTNRFTVGSGWRDAHVLDREGEKYKGYPQVAMDGFGNAIAVWVEYDGTRGSIWFSRYE